MLIINLVKKLYISVSGLITYLSLPLVAFAIGNEAYTTATADPCSKVDNISAVICRLAGTGGANLGKTIQGVVVFFIVLAVIIALFYLLYGGVKWITSKGDKTEVEAAKNHIIAAIAGLIVVILAVFIMTLVLAAFGISFGDLRIPVIGVQ